MKPFTILLATDGSAEAVAAVDFWRALPLPLGTTFHIVCAAESPDAAGETPSEAMESLIHFERRECEAAVSDAATALAAEGLRIVPYVYEAPAVEAILKVAHQEDVGLISLGAKRRGGLLDLLLGGITVPLARRAARPVLAVRPLQNGMRSILVATDGSPGAQRAAGFAARLPLPDHAKVLVAHVLSPYEEEAAAHDWEPLVCETTIAEMRSAEGSTVAAHPFRSEMRSGDPAAELLKLIKDTQTDLVVLGARKRSWIDNTLDGNVADRLLLEASCSVLLVP